MQELIAIQQNGPKALGFFGTRNMGFLHQNLIEILSYAMVLTVRRPLGGAKHPATPTACCFGRHPSQGRQAAWTGQCGSLHLLNHPL